MRRTPSRIEQYVIMKYQQGMTMKEISELISLNKTTIFEILKRNNVETRTKGGIYKLDSKSIVSDYLKGISGFYLGKKYNVTAGTIYNYLKSEGVLRDNIYHNRNLRRDYFKTIDSYDKAYFLGFLITDGCVTENNNVSLQIKSSDYKILEVFREKTQNENKLYFDNRGCVTFHCKSIEMQQDLARYGVVFRKTYKVFFPYQLVYEKYISHLIRGIFDGDGWITKTTIGLCSANKLFLDDIRTFLVSELDLYPITTVKDVRKNGSVLYSIQWSSKRDYKILGDYIYRDKHDCYLERKFKRFLTYVNTEVTI